MNARPTKPLRAYFLIDRSVGEIDSRIDLLERQFKALMSELEKDGDLRSRVQPVVISMGEAKLQVIEATPLIEFQLPRKSLGCDLGEALKAVADDLPRHTPDTDIEIFVLLNNEPAGDWRSRLEVLKKARKEVRVTVFAFTGDIRVDTLRAIKTPNREALRLLQFTSETTKQAFERILVVLKSVEPTGIQPVAADPAHNRQPASPIVPQAAAPEPQASPASPPPIVEAIAAQTVAPPPVQEPSIESGAEAMVKQPDTVESAPTDQAINTEPPQAEAVTAQTPGGGGVASSETPMVDLGAEGNGEEIEAAPKVEPPPVGEGGVATIWKEIEPPEELGDRVPHSDTRALSVSDDWRIIGSSRRGKMHAHKGIFREDAFALGESNGWHLMVVADGGGSCPLSRVGSQLAADTAVDEMSKIIKSTTLPADEIAEMALRKGLEKAWKALEAEANRRSVPLGHLGTTFLAALHKPAENGSVVGVAQVGDGLLAAQFADGKIVALAEPDVGETASVTLFLTSKHWKEWIERVSVQTLDMPPRLLAAMCDGVADDFIPFEQYLHTLFDQLNQVIQKEQPEQELLKLLSYEKRGSFDDRTVTVLYQVKAGADREQSAQAEAKATLPPEDHLSQEQTAPTPQADADSAVA